MNKKANGLGIAILMVLVIALIGGALVLFGVIPLPQGTVGTSGTQQSTIQQISEASNAGKVSSLGVYVYDTANNNKETKVAVPVYCQDDTGKFVIDGTSSSATAEITGKTEIGRTVTCYAYNSTYQVGEPVTVKIEGESPHIVIKAFKVPTSGQIQFYTDTYATGNEVTNVSIGTAGQSDTLQKMRYTNNNSQTVMPLGGFYLAVPSPSNVSKIDIAGSVSLHGMSKASSQLVASDLTSRVSSRKDNFDFVFEIDDDSATAGNQALLMEEQDYLETGTVTVKAESTACSGVSTADQITSYAFPKGYYRSQKSSAMNYGIETDGTTSSLLTVRDLNGDTFSCTA